MGEIVVVFDTNVVVSAFRFGGTPWDAFVRALDDRFVIAVSPDTLDELERVVQYDQLGFTEDEQEMFPVLYGRVSTTVRPEVDVTAIESDPDDNKFLECAVAAEADYLVSGDETHVQPVETFRGTDVVSPAEFLSRVPPR